MLPEVAAGELELSTIINPLRRLLRRVKSFVGMIEAIDLETRCVTVSHAFDGHTHVLSYDQLVLALGAGTNFFDLPGVEDSCLTVKTLGDAVTIRNQLITHLEEANSECAAGERQPLLTFIVVAGGLTRVSTNSGQVHCALVANPDAGGFYPPTAQHALREGSAVAGNVEAALYGGQKTPFRYSSIGQLAAIGPSHRGGRPSRDELLGLHRLVRPTPPRSSKRLSMPGRIAQGQVV
jgi:NADH dehydrogenase FAD-containing subunit